MHNEDRRFARTDRDGCENYPVFVERKMKFGRERTAQPTVYEERKSTHKTHKILDAPWMIYCRYLDFYRIG